MIATDTQKHKVPAISVGGSELNLTRLAFGAWRLSDTRGPEGKRLTTGNVADLISHSLGLGITTFDHADIYGDYSCEEIFGAAVAELGINRSRLQLVSKCGIKLVSARRPHHRNKSYDTSREHILTSVERSLRNLRTDYLDLLLIHRPDPLLDPSEVASAFESLKTAGKVRFFGVSNFSPMQVEALQSYLPMPIVSNQVELSPLAHQVLTDGTLDHCLKMRMTPMIWSPLAGGRLVTGKAAIDIRVREVLTRIGHELGGASVDQVAIAWALQHPSRPIIVTGTTVAERLSAAAFSATDIKLSREQWHEVWSAGMGHEVP